MTANTAAARDPRVDGIINDLRAAAERAELALSALDRRKRSQCQSCGRQVFSNFREANAADAVAGTVAKLRRWAEALEHPDLYSVRGVLRDRFDRDEDDTHTEHDGATGGR